jgi:hypothetical protein
MAKVHVQIHLKSPKKIKNPQHRSLKKKENRVLSMLLMMKEEYLSKPKLK